MASALSAIQIVVAPSLTPEDYNAQNVLKTIRYVVAPSLTPEDYNRLHTDQ